jgi:ParB family transcriptional regulator, chromosome partitioning protein
MLIPIENITVKDRIRKDFGDIEELAQDIRDNGLINPPVVTPDYELIAGERRLRAMQHLGYQQIEVRVMAVNDYLHQLNLEISENENRKEFTKKERFEYANKLIEIKRLSGANLHPEEDEITDEAAKESGIGSRRQFYKEKTILENANEETLEAWDKGDISTHAAYQQIIKERDEALRAKTESDEMVESLTKNIDELAAENKAISDDMRKEQTAREKAEKETLALKKQIQDNVCQSQTYAKEIEDLKSKLEDAKDDDNSEEVERLQESIESYQKQFELSQKEIQELKDKLSIPVEPVVIEKVPEDVEKELESLRNKIGQAECKEIIAFKGYYQVFGDNCKNLLLALNGIESINSELCERYRNALLNLVGKFETNLRGE